MTNSTRLEILSATIIHIEKKGRKGLMVEFIHREGSDKVLFMRGRDTEKLFTLMIWTLSRKGDCIVAEPQEMVGKAVKVARLNGKFVGLGRKEYDQWMWFPTMGSSHAASLEIFRANQLQACANAESFALSY